MMDLTDGFIYERNITEGFTRDGIHTNEYDMWLRERHAPTPTEKVITESVPFMQGEYDFSNVLGFRVYENRPITYVFEIIGNKYHNRKSIQTSLENWLMRSGFAPLYDTHDEGYRYMAKCESVDVVDNEEYKTLEVTITFEAYPFKIGELLEGNDIWDTFNFEIDVAQVTEFNITGTEQVVLYNAGSNIITPKIRTTSPMTIIKDGVTYSLQQGETTSDEFNLSLGENNLTIQGNGTIEFLFHKELI